MKYVAIICLCILAIYNLQDSKANYKVLRTTFTLYDYTETPPRMVKTTYFEAYIWRFIFHFFLDLTIMFAFLAIWRKAASKHERLIYLYTSVFFGLYAAYNLAALTSKNANEYLARENSLIWGIVFGSVVILILTALLINKLYDQRG